MAHVKFGLRPWRICIMVGKDEKYGFCFMGIVERYFDGEHDVKCGLKLWQTSTVVPRGVINRFCFMDVLERGFLYKILYTASLHVTYDVCDVWGAKIRFLL